MGMWDEITEPKSKLTPEEGGVKCFVKGLEFVDGDNMTQTRYLLWNKDENGVVREIVQNLPNPFSNPEYQSANLGNFWQLFGSLSPKTTDEFKAAMKAEFGDEGVTHELFHNKFMTLIDPNYETVPIEYLLVYPVKNGVASAYASKPTVGRFIRSDKYAPEPLAEWNPTYMSLVPGVGNGKTPDSKAVVPSRDRSKADY